MFFHDFLGGRTLNRMPSARRGRAGGRVGGRVMSAARRWALGGGRLLHAGVQAARAIRAPTAQALPCALAPRVPAAAPTREGVQRVHQLQLGVAAQRDHLVHLLELEADDVEASHELVQAPLAQLLVLAPHLAGGW